MSFLSPAGSAATKVQKLRIPMPPWSTIGGRLPNTEGQVDDVLGMHEEHVGRIGCDHLLRLADQHLALGRIRLAALILCNLVVGLVGVADEIEALVAPWTSGTGCTRARRDRCARGGPPCATSWCPRSTGRGRARRDPSPCSRPLPRGWPSARRRSRAASGRRP